MNGLRVAIADDHAIVRTGYRRLLELEPNVSVVAEFGDCETAYTWLGAHPADVLILDLSMPGRGGLETLRRLKARVPALKILVFSMHGTPAMVSQAMQAGADGYLTKSSAPDALIAAVQEVAVGGRPLSEDAARALDEAAGDRQAPHRVLSPREFQVFTMLAQGLVVDEIAGQLRVSAKTVANYQTVIRQKTGLSNALEMFRSARAHALLE
ncbi:response regulator [Aromatoleum toluvorans]|uniref:Response regulator n=1 Tax=Aromatoleum toluvorans TaxID=92002 RepID=A0ABX1Q4J8_9RHOO|nr:response regulator transcription factor [Aromatoleum toluvorans]NMG45825.1 response regulator [Aromatoleum toluvorans]